MKKTTIIIDGKPFTYDDESEDITYDSLSPISEEDAKNLLALTKKLFDQCGLRFYLFYGTLLGAVRDNGIIKGDEDVDVYVDSEEQLRKNIPFLYDNGLKLCRIEEHLVYSFHSENKSFIDVYIKDKLPSSIWSFWCDSISGYAVPKRYVKKHDVINFLGMDLLCPHKPERLLEYWYGKTWKIPISGHDYTYELPSRYWWLTKGKGWYETIKYIIIYSIKHPFSAIKKIFKKGSV